MIRRLVALALILAACGGQTAVPPTTTSIEAPTAPTTTNPLDPLAVFATGEVAVSGSAWRVALADTATLRSRGLMGVTDLGDLDGMLFIFEETTQVAFFMLDTLIPLDIAFFAEDGTLVDLLTMTPCEREPCPTYAAAGPFRYALEAPQGAFAAIDQPFLDVDDL